jgi:hypothetical protein
VLHSVHSKHWGTICHLLTEMADAGGPQSNVAPSAFAVAAATHQRPTLELQNAQTTEEEVAHSGSHAISRQLWDDSRQAFSNEYQHGMAGVEGAWLCKLGFSAVSSQIWPQNRSHRVSIS